MSGREPAVQHRRQSQCHITVCSPASCPYDLTRGGTLFNFHGHQQHQSVRVLYPGHDQRSAISPFSAGLRDDQYNGLTSTTAPSRAWEFPTSFKRHRHRPARGLFAHLRNALQREPDSFERDRRRRARPERLRFQCRADPARLPQSVQHRLPAGHRPLARRRCRLLLEVHSQCLRLQRAVQHPDHVSDCLAQLQAGWRHGARQHHRICTASRLIGPSAILARATSRPKTAA